MRRAIMKSACAMTILGFVSATGCGQVLDIPSDPQLVEEQQQATGPWACLGQEAEPMDPENKTATVRVFACNFISTNCSEEVTGLTANLCDKRDVGCTNPIEEGITEKNGLFEFEVDTAGAGFDGYLEVFASPEMCTDEEVFGEAGALLCGLNPDCDPENPDENCMVPTFAPAMLFFNPGITADVEQPFGLPLLPSAGLPAVVMAAGADLDPTTGNLFITAVDCEGMPAAGVTYSISDDQDKVTQLYVKDGAVTNSELQTDASGIGGFVGVPPGFAEVEAFNEDNVRIGSIGVISRPFTMTYSALVPSP